MTVLYGTASFVYFLMYYVVGYRKAVVIQNISRAFPEKRYDEVRVVVRQFYVCFTAYFAEILKSVSVSPQDFDRKIVFVNKEIIDAHIQAKRNVILCMGHCGNWELLNFMPYKLSYDMYAVYKPLRSDFMNLLMTKFRTRFGMKLISSKAIVRHILTQKDSAAPYLFIADQYTHVHEEKYKSDLLHQTTYFFPGMEKLARASHSAVVYLHITQTSKGNYTITCMPICDEPGSMQEGEITREYAALLTKNIKDYPPGWLWTHKRWKNINIYNE